MAVPYSTAFAPTQRSSHEYVIKIHADYSYGLDVLAAAHGASMISLLWESVALHCRTTLAKHQQPDTLSCYVQFLRPAAVGQALISLQDVQLSKTTSTLHATLHQSNKDRVVAYFTIFNRLTTKGMSLPTPYTPSPPIPPISFPLLRAGHDPLWTNFHRPYDISPNTRFLSNFHIAVERTAHADKRTMQSYLGWAHPHSRWTTASLGVACDLFLPASENFFDSYRSAQGMADEAVSVETSGHKGTSVPWTRPYWYLTLNVSIEVKRALPEEGVEWLFIRMRTKEVVEGKIDVSGEVWDAEGRLVAVTQQLWVVVEVPNGVVGMQRGVVGRGSKI
ncbi:uncharacterized protein LTR77_001376 [Saxophila tyrrhenica]|uniref:Thioesterase-like superfamily-domain-containing protein n=1 Tax=Saxophila tyrrhenica TaxID=1690608 RepID=A0AAV9PND3_9PEZI|nr:hypothetical protein LTR77_001376 [Saxophila tyrrhenica]